MNEPVLLDYIKTFQWVASALAHGALAVHLKIYPLIYLPSIFLHLCKFSTDEGLPACWRRLFLNWKGFAYAAISLVSFGVIVAFFYYIYGDLFLEEFLLYHIKRRDIKHNFSPYFYPLALVDGNESLSKIVGFLAFLPQFILIVYFAFRYHNDLPFCWFMSTFAFVTFNKVCTSQYFVWYIVFLPLIVNRIKVRWMVFYLIGLGLGDVEDITVKGLNIVKKCKRVHLEAYTSILCYGLDKSKLEEFYGREVIEADRTVVEQNSDEILDGADVDDVAMLVVGDPFGATTHTDLVLRAKERNIPVKVVHNASIMNAVGCCGLQLYNFGETVSIVMWLDGWEPDSYYDKIASNMEKGFHTLCLLDIKTKEQSIENMMKGRKIYEPPRYLTCAEAATQLLKIAERKKASGIEPVYNESSPCVGLARVGWDDQKIVYSSLKEMSKCDMGPPLHSLILPGHMHPLEIDMLNTFKLSV
ncbi:diphthine synthase [Ancylostoma caninum]|uniref:GPI alpha-1,4-mannosyltransferase I, catalytic subunit n=1 Tax=Ancylostoma caninum TaxID=29170 RepID=A0A368G733_ANCCA|nr:diphthine synthase [Ancylostoma caninum]